MSRFKNWFAHILPEMQSVFRRFPLAILMVAGLTLSILYDENVNHFSYPLQQRLWGGFVLAGYIALILALIGEGRRKRLPLLLQIPVVGLAFGLAFYFDSLSFLVWPAILAAILYLGNAPFFRAPRNDVAVWDFTHKLWTAVLFTVAGSVIYMIGLFAISEALRRLFGMDIDDLVKDVLLPIGLAFLAPMAWLSMLPDPLEDDGDSLRNPGFISRAVGFLGTWILAPLTLIYAAILVLYGIKILMMHELPKGVIGRLVTPYLIIGTLTWLILDPPFIQEKRLARWYSKAWFPVMIPAALLVLVSAFVRIGQYGLTPGRYLLVLAGVWALGVAVWSLIRRERFNIRVIPGFAAVLLVLASIGPWGAEGLSVHSQTARLRAGLIANGWLDEAGHLRPQAELKIKDEQAASQAKGAFNYLRSHDKSDVLAGFLPEDETLDKIMKTGEGKPVPGDTLAARFGLDKIPGRVGPPPENSVYTYAVPKAFPVTGYDYVTNANQGLFFLGKRRHVPASQIRLGDYDLFQDGEELVIRRRTDGKVLSRFSVLDWVESRLNRKTHRLELEPVKILWEAEGKRLAIHVNNADYSPESKRGNVFYVVLLKGITPEE